MPLTREEPSVKTRRLTCTTLRTRRSSRPGTASASAADRISSAYATSSRPRATTRVRWLDSGRGHSRERSLRPLGRQTRVGPSLQRYAVRLPARFFRAASRRARSLGVAWRSEAAERSSQSACSASVI
jgi:hypothetical protein